MNNKSISNMWVVVPNWNGQENIASCIESLFEQSIEINILIVDNGSSDKSVDILESFSGRIEAIYNTKNMGFSGGVNKGINFAMNKGANLIALLNNDAYVDKYWAESLISSVQKNNKIGIVASLMIHSKHERIDSTGENYTNWGLPYPRGRGQKSHDTYSSQREIFGASGGASLYRVSMLKDIGLFDEDFFAYYEDVDISFRAQLAGWKVVYEPLAIAYHKIGESSSKIHGFTTYQTIKNLPWLFWKNVPTKYLFTVGIRFYFAYFTFIISALLRRQFWLVIKGVFVSTMVMPKKLIQRHGIQASARVSPEYIWSIMTHDLPPNAIKLRKIRSFYHKLIKKA